MCRLLNINHAMRMIVNLKFSKFTTRLSWRAACMHVYTSVDFIVYNKNKYRFRYVGEHLQHLILQYQLPNENTYYIRIPAHCLPKPIIDDETIGV